MEKSDKVYRFKSRSQHVLVVNWQGRRYKVKFTSPYSGVSRYSTSYETLADEIRKSWAFKSGQIQEETPVEHIKEQAPATGKQGGTNKKKQEEIPAWMKRSVKVKQEHAPSPSQNKEENKAENNPSTVAENTETAPRPAEQVMFGIKLEEVESYMEAKEYVRDVLGVDVTRKEEVKKYCQDNGIVFPNFSFE